MRGELFTVTGQNAKGAITITGAGGRELTLPLKDAARFQVFEERRITLGKGDQIRITRNGPSANGIRLNNGDGHAIAKFSRKGDIVLSNGATLAADHGHLAYGYCQTSHSSQSKSVAHVLVAQGSESFVASSREQFYVSASRGTTSIKVFTDSRSLLQEAVGNTSTRTSALELAEITKRDFAKMSDALNSRQWRDQVQSRKAEGMARSHVHNLLKERRQETHKKPSTMEWRQYVEMRRGLSGADGKSRSKGHPQGTEKKKANIQNKGRAFLRPTQLRTADHDRLPKNDNKPAPEKGPEPKAETKAKPSRKDRLVSAYETAARNLARVAERIKSSRSKLQGATKDVPAKKPTAPAKQPRSSMKQVVEHAARQRRSASDTAAKTAKQTKSQVATPAPVIRRK